MSDEKQSVFITATPDMAFSLELAKETFTTFEKTILPILPEPPKEWWRRGNPKRRKSK